MISAPVTRLRQRAGAPCIIFLALALPPLAGADCNENCIDDTEEYIYGTILDCNLNAVPDECELEPLNADFVKGFAVAPGGIPRSMEVVDLDGDGLPELVTGDASFSSSHGSGISLHSNRGSGGFEPPVSHVVPYSIPETLALADLDGDQDLDIAIVARDSIEPCDRGPDRVSIIENRGGRVLALLASIEAGHGSTDLRPADIDGDGDADLVITDSGREPGAAGAIMILRNRGTASFDPPDRIPTGSDFPAGIAPGDLDGDGDQDLVVIHRGSSSLNLFLNRGGGTFAGPEEVEVPAHPASIVADDVDADGDADVIALATDPDPGLVLLRNPGRAWGWESVVLNGPFTSLATADFDGDGRRELAASTEGNVQVLQGLAEGALQKVSRHAVLGEAAHLVAPGDIDGDGDEDIVAGGEKALHSIHNKGGLGPLALEGVSVPLAAADLDGDGDIDLAASSRPGRIAILSNRGGGVFGRGAQILERTTASSSVLFADLDGDGDPDMLATVPLDFGDGSGLALHQNPGDGRFPPSYQDLVLRRDHDFDNVRLGIAAADLDGDGDSDAVFAAPPGVSILLNEGDGKLSEGGGIIIGPVADRVAAADLNGDGRVDLITGNSEGEFSSVSVIMGSGGGKFMTARNYAVAPEPRWLAPGDLDGDGDLDLVSAGPTVLENRGNGTFHESRRIRGLAGCFGALEDFDGDGDLDIASAGGTIFFNGGDGTFDERSVGWTSSGCSMLAADLDGDGDTDLLGEDREITLSWNLGGGSFDGRHAIDLPGRANVVDLADPGADGDLLAVLASDSHVGFLPLEKAGGFGPVEWRPLPGGREGAIAAGDLDGDGRLDVAYSSRICGIAGKCSVTFTLLLDRGKEGWEEQVLDLEGPLVPRDVVVSDLDRDGDLDLAGMTIRCQAGCISSVSVFLNDGRGKLSLHHLPVLVDAPGASLVAVDLDGDGETDIVTDTPAFYRNLGGGAFAGPVPLPRSCCGGLAAGDLDGDGDTDLVTNQTFLRNLGGGRTFEVLMHPRGLDALAPPADMDGDGRLDLVSAGGALIVHVRGTRNGLEPMAFIPLDRGSPVSLDARDVDRDGRPDILACWEEGLTIYWNRSRGPFLPREARDLDADGLLDGCQKARFTRGDSNGDGAIDMGDPISILLHLFAGGGPPGCLDAADANDDSTIDIADGLHILTYLFQGGTPPVHPGPDQPCDRDPGPGAGLGCKHSGC